MKKLALILISIAISSSAFADVVCKSVRPQDLKNLKFNLTRSLKIRGVYKSIFNHQKNTLVIPSGYCHEPILRRNGVKDTLCDLSFNKDHVIQVWISSHSIDLGVGANGVLVQGDLAQHLNSATASKLRCEEKK